jgi:natural product precursor
MAKLKLKNLSNIGDILTSEELKHVYGGEVDSGSKCACLPSWYNMHGWR